jgi:Fatty acid synthase subunit alpha Acyl carrier domain
MGQKTIQRKIASAERSADSQVQFLASTHDAKELCYEYDPPTSLGAEAVEDTQLSVEASPRLLEPARNIPPPPPYASAAPVAVEDVPLSGEEIIQALVARKLKKPIAQISASKSIKELSGGMFTFQADHSKSR